MGSDTSGKMGTFLSKGNDEKKLKIKIEKMTEKMEAYKTEADTLKL